MSHRDYGIDIYELNKNTFVSDLDGNEFQVEVKPSCNFTRRLNDSDIRGVVIHYTNGSSQSAWSWWQNQYPGTSAHYLINRDGSIIQSVSEIYSANHIGCYWSDEFCRNCPDELCGNKGYFYDPEETTIAIELENAGPVFPEDGWYTDIFHIDIGSLKGRKQMLEFRRKVQMIFQDLYDSLDPKLTIFDIVAEPLRALKLCHSRDEISQRVRDALMLVELTPYKLYEERYPHQLSGGQRQRVAIARALVCDPEFVIADEPVSMLDVSLRAGILNLLLKLNQEKGIGVLLITHDLATARFLCNRIV